MGKLEVSKVKGDGNPADFMTKISEIKDIKERLGGMNIRCDGL